MIVISFFAAELTFAVVWLAARLAVWVKQRKIIWKREAVLLLLYIDLAVIIRFVFFARDTVNGHVQPLVFDPAAIFPLRVNLIPIVHLLEYDSLRDAVWNVIGNTALFIPSGVILPVVYKKLDSFRKVLAAGVFISLCIELLQLPFGSRVSDIDDLILNTVGVAVGYGIYAAFKALKRRLAKQKSKAQ